MTTIDKGSNSFMYARQILGIPDGEDLPAHVEQKIYWTLRAMHRVRVKDLSLEIVSLICGQEIAAEEAQEQAAVKKAAPVKKVVEKKKAVDAPARFPVSDEQQETKGQ